MPGAAGERPALASLEPSALNRELSQNGKVSSIDPKAALHEIPQYRVNGTVLRAAADFARTLLSLRSPYSETLKVAILDPNDRVVHSQVPSAGTLDASVVDARDFIRLMELHGQEGNRLLMSHNHPSGDPSPSTEDVAMTRKHANCFVRCAGEGELVFPCPGTFSSIFRHW